MFLESALSKAEKCLSRNKNDKAITFLLKAAAENPTNLYILNTLADVYTKVGNSHASCEYYLIVAREYERLNELGKAIGAYRKIHNLDANNTEVNLTLARLYMFDRSYPQAEYFLKVCANDLLERPKLNARDEDIALKLIRMLHTISGVSPSSLETLTFQSRLYRKIGRSRLAAEVDLRIGLIYARDGKTEIALKLLRSLLPVFPGHIELIECVTNIMADQGHLTEAIKCLESCLIANPSNIQILLQKGRLLTRFGEFQQAEELYHRAVFSDPSYYKDVLDFAYRLMDAEHFDWAVKQIDYINSDMTYLQKMEAMTFLKALLERDSHNISALTKLAYMYGEMNDVYQLSAVYVALFRTYVEKGDAERAHYVGKLLLEMGYREVQFLEAYESNKDSLKSTEGTEKSDYHRVFADDHLIKVDTTKVRLWPYYEVQTQEVEARTLPERKDDVAELLLNIDLLLKYGARDKALEMMNETIEKYGDNQEIREKLKGIRLDKSPPAPVASDHFRLSQLLESLGKLEKPPEPDLEVSDLTAVCDEVRTEPSRFEGMPESGSDPIFSGLLGMFTLIDVIQLISNSQKTGTLSLGTHQSTGRIHFSGGGIVSAEFLDLIGEEAVFALLQISDGIFEFHPTPIPPHQTILGSTTHILLECLRRLDEAKSTETSGGQPAGPRGKIETVSP